MTAVNTLFRASFLGTAVAAKTRRGFECGFGQQIHRNPNRFFRVGIFQKKSETNSDFYSKTPTLHKEIIYPMNHRMISPICVVQE